MTTMKKPTTRKKYLFSSQNRLVTPEVDFSEMVGETIYFPAMLSTRLKSYSADLRKYQTCSVRLKEEDICMARVVNEYQHSYCVEAFDISGKMKGRHIVRKEFIHMSKEELLEFPFTIIDFEYRGKY